MKNVKPIAIHVDRLAAVLDLHGISLKRTKVLEIAAAAFGYHNTHECTAASQRGDLTPPAAEPLFRMDMPGGEALIVLRDPLANAPYAVDESFIEQTADDRKEIYGPSPYGHLLDLGAVADHPATASTGSPDTVIPTVAEGSLCILVELEVDGPVTDEIVRSNVQRAIHGWRSAEGLSGDDDEGMIGEIMTHVLPRGQFSQAISARGLDRMMQDAGRDRIHVALIHHDHGIDLRLGTTLASVSRQVGQYVRDNWDSAWQADQDAPESERADIPETPEGLDDDRAEEMFFQAMGRFSATHYVDYEVIDMEGAAKVAPPPAVLEPFPGVPDDLWEIFAARDGDTFHAIYRVTGDENPERKGRELAAKSFGLNLEDYASDYQDDSEFEEDEDDFSDFDGDTDGITISQADFDPGQKALLSMSWEAAQRLPVGDPLRDRIRQEVLSAMPRPGAS